MASLVSDSASAWAGGAMKQAARSAPPTAMKSGRGVMDTLSIAYGGTSGWAPESARFSLRQLSGAEPAGWRFTPTAPPSFNDASAAICEGASEDLIISMLRYNPVLASQKNKYGVTLLHWAAYYCAPESVVRALVVARSGVQVGVRLGELLAEVGAHADRDVRLVHWVLVYLVFTRARHV